MAGERHGHGMLCVNRPLNNRAAGTRTVEVSKLVLPRLLDNEGQDVTILRNNGKKRRKLPTPNDMALHPGRRIFINTAVSSFVVCFWRNSQ
jgi:hypothetical protein